ncbi:right-handed parallel beta-helix repeat-containing protein [Cellulomonas endophytica]|uniref:right-handed parallel beta-helix repeat-containing protein n=1 Tax=Cellulomonas endophytica TaxID=2494735 RepID=UPI0010116926|nr:right-handed parallel beta-helix repeat-containing protein [Cellulomonas endophytica]
MSRARTTGRRAAGTLLAAAVLGTGLLVAPPAASATSAEEPSDEATAGLEYPGNAQTEPALVADEEDRLADVQTVGRMIQWGKLPVFGAYRLSTGNAYTLVLTRRSEPYAIADLLRLAPQTFVREPDGTYVLSENIVVQPGARLALSDTGPLTIRMASDTDRFVSIVNLGGELEVVGTEASPVTIASWDRDAGRADTRTEDGRAYVRSVGGKVTLEGVHFEDLGFWSGRTGGVALTGVDRPSEGALEEYGRDLGDAVAENNRASGLDVPFGVVPDANQPPVDPAAPVDPEAAAEAAAAEQDAAATDLAAATDGTAVEGLLPVGTLPVPYTDDEDPEYSYVSAKVQGATFDGNAFGLFVSSANGVDISGSEIRNSIVDGLVMHRYVVNAAVADTVSSDNAGNGIVLARATTGIVVSEVTSRRNGASGIVLRGSALADGPSATGMAVGDYGNNSISNSRFDDNARFGIEIIGGDNISVNANDLAGNDMGIVVRDEASDVTLVGNHLEENVRHAIALRDGASDVGISGNVIAGSPTAVYVRDSTAVVERNTITAATSHAFTVVGASAGTVIEQNTAQGRGPSAIDVKRAEDVTVGENDLSAWTSTKPFWTIVRNTLQPLTVMWILLGLLLVATALAGTRHRRRRTRTHPYEAQRRLAELVQMPPLVRVEPALVGASSAPGDGTAPAGAAGAPGGGRHADGSAG